MSQHKKTDPNPHAVSPGKIVVMVAVVLVGVAAGSMLALKKSDDDLRKRGAAPGALGHVVPAKKEITPDPSSSSIDPNEMAWIPAGSFWMGNESGQSDEKPVHKVNLDGFWMDKTEVTNEQFDRFVRATGYITVAEKPPRAEDYPGVDPAMLVAGSIVFAEPTEEISSEDLKNPAMHMLLWKYAHGANWRHPEGKDSTIQGREKHPVVHICWEDAMAYCQWAGKRLPTEAEWEYAARGGLDQKHFVWGDELLPAGKWNANIWQGKFPLENQLADGFRATGPVGTYSANAYGLFDMAGNVWEWCSDWYTPDYYSQSPDKNPPGPTTSFDPNEPGVMKKVTRGGSFLCHESYCIGYRPSSRMKTSPDTGLSHTGFRCVKNGPPPGGKS